MTLAEYRRLLAASPPMREWKGPSDAEKSATLDGALTLSLGKLEEDYDWQFSQKEGSLTITADSNGAGETDYLLKGNNDDCRKVSMISYGSDSDPMDEITYPEYMAKYRNVTLSGDPAMWVQLGIEQTYPKIRLLGSPTVADVCPYLYLRRGMTIDTWPEGQAMVLIYKALEYLADNSLIRADGVTKSYDFRGKLDRALKSMLHTYAATHPFGRRALTDKTWRTRNVARNKLFGA